MSNLRAAWFVCNLALSYVAGCQGRPSTDVRTANEDLGQQTPSAKAPTSTVTAAVTQPPFSNVAPASASPASVASVAATSDLASATSSTATSSTATAAAVLDADGNPLPQTEDRPSATGALFQRRMEQLVRAIAEDEPELALPSFFPVEAYKQVKAIAKPEQDWKRRLVAAFERNIHEYHRQLGAAASVIRFSRVEIADPKVKWMKPGSEGNRVGYFRVVRSKLVVAKADGSEAALELTSLISWRGEWYVVHLHGFE